MTTNSPNPVDGDVQALIADCEREIADLEKALTTWGETWSPYLQSKLKRQKIALAALTAEPFEYLTWHQGCRAPDDCEIYSTVAEKGDKSDDGSDAIPVYTSPPAQLLRPVELPESQRLNATAQPVIAPEWTNEQCLEFLSIAFRYANISGDIEMDDIRLGIIMVNAAAPGGQCS